MHSDWDNRMMEAPDWNVRGSCGLERPGLRTEEEATAAREGKSKEQWRARTPRTRAGRGEEKKYKKKRTNAGWNTDKCARGGNAPGLAHPGGEGPGQEHPGKGRPWTGTSGAGAEKGGGRGGGKKRQGEHTQEQGRWRERTRRERGGRRKRRRSNGQAHEARTGTSEEDERMGWDNRVVEALD